MILYVCTSIKESSLKPLSDVYHFTIDFFIISLTSNNFINMMSKFHKTSYSRGGNFNAVNSSHGRRNPTSFGQSEWMGMKSEQPLQRKIEIQSSLLLNHKNYQRQSVNPPETMTRKVTNRSEVKLYETTTGFTNPRERPQSKQ